MQPELLKELLKNSDSFLSLALYLSQVRKMKCKVCGRTEEELQDEFGSPSEIKEHQGIKKCSKCIREYESETGDEDTGANEEIEDADWKDEIFA